MLIIPRSLQTIISLLR